MAKISYKKKI